MAGPIAFLAPDPIQSTQLIPGGNTPASGGLLFVYQVGSTTKSNSYTDPSASTARTNPIVLDSGGNVPGNGEVWITSTAKFVLAPSNDTDPPSSPYWSKDNYPGINLITAAQVQALSAQSEWVQGSTATFVGVTGFSVVGDQTALYTTGRRVKATVTGGDRFGIVTSAVLATGSTAVGVTLDSGTLNGGLSAVSYGILSTPNGSVPWTKFSTTGIDITGGIVNVSSMTSPSLSLSTGIFSLSSTSSFQINISSSVPIINTATSTLFNHSISINDPVLSTIRLGSSSALTGNVNIPYTLGAGGINSRGFGNSTDVSLIFLGTVNGVPNVIQIGDSSINGIYAKGRSGAGAPGNLDLPAGFFTLWRDTAASTTRFYYNNAGTISSSAAFL